MFPLMGYVIEENIMVGCGIRWLVQVTDASAWL